MSKVDAATGRCIESSFLEAGWSRDVVIPNFATKRSANWFELAENSAWASLAIPQAFGGQGGSLLDAASAQREIARLNGSLAIALNMHAFTIGIMVEYWEQHRDTSWMLLEGLATSGGLIASAFAEPGGSSNFLISKSAAKPVDNGWLLSGRKTPCSLASSARIYCVSATDTKSGDAIVLMCPAESDGITVETEPWPSIGMRHSDTGSVSFDGVFIDRRLVFYQAPVDKSDYLVTAGLVWFSVLTAATYHGVLCELLDEAASNAQSRGRGRNVWADILIGQSAQDVFGLGSTVQALSAMWQERCIDDESALASALALRALTVSVRDSVVARLGPVVGSRSFVKGTRASELVLDSLAATYHPPHLSICDSELGRHVRNCPIELGGT